MTRKIWYDIDYSFKVYTFGPYLNSVLKTRPELFRGMLEICSKT